MLLQSVGSLPNIQTPRYHYEAQTGQSAKHAIEQALKISQRMQAPIALNFCNVPLVIKPESQVGDLVQFFKTAKEATKATPFLANTGQIGKQFMSKFQQLLRVLL